MIINQLGHINTYELKMRDDNMLPFQQFLTGLQPNAPKVLLVYEDYINTPLIVKALNSNGYITKTERRSGDIINHLNVLHQYALVILYLPVMDMKFNKIIEYITFNNVPLLLIAPRKFPELSLTRSTELLTIPFSMTAFISAVKAKIKVTNNSASLDRKSVSHSIQPNDNGGSNEFVRFGSFSFDILQGTLLKGSKLIGLTSNEKNILKYMTQHQGRVIGRSELATQLDVAIDRSVDVTITRLRKKIETNTKQPQFIKTERGGGYSFHIS
jgi:DNA-binding response OmpR family regulator